MRLALQSEAQSGVAVTEPTASDKGETQPAATPRAVKEVHAPSEPSIEPAQNGKSSKLGKRKHEAEEQEDEPTSTKKSRTAVDQSHAHQDTGAEAPAAAQEDHAMPDSSADKPSSANAAGDPNYRQGKKKKAKLTPRDRKKLAQQKAAAEAPSPAEAVPVRTRATLLASTEIDHSPAPSFSTPTKHQPILRDRSKGNQHIDVNAHRSVDVVDQGLCVLEAALIERQDNQLSPASAIVTIRVSVHSELLGGEGRSGDNHSSTSSKEAAHHFKGDRALTDACQKDIESGIAAASFSQLGETAEVNLGQVIVARPGRVDLLASPQRRARANGYI